MVGRCPKVGVRHGGGEHEGGMLCQVLSPDGGRGPPSTPPIATRGIALPALESRHAPEVLHDDLLDVAVPPVHPPYCQQRLEPLPTCLADPNQNACMATMSIVRKAGPTMCRTPSETQIPPHL